MADKLEEYRAADAFGLFRSFLRHVTYVRLAIQRVAQELDNRATVHDLSKLQDDEFAGFARINRAGRVHKFGSPEYREGVRRERSTIDLHFSRNSHHPENQPQNFLDIIEMVCDWWGARKGYGDSRSWQESLALNLDHKAKYLNEHQLWLAKEVASWLDGVEEK